MSAQGSEPGFRRFLGRLARRPGQPDDAVRERPGRPPARASLCLAVVFGEHSPFLAELAASVRPHVSSWVAIDTAPVRTGTVADSVLHRELAGLPGRVESRPGMHPADARNELFALVPPDATHVLLLDDDLVLSVDGSLADLVARVPGDALVVAVEDNGFEHRRPLILRAGREWSVADDVRRGVRSGSGVVTATFDAARLVRRADGTVTRRTLLADRQHLYGRIEADPADTGTMFRLARTLADLGETSPAMWWFSRCAEAAGPSEEAYCAWCAIGEMHLLAGRVEEAASAFMWAVQSRPARIEAYYHLAQIFNGDRDHAKARMWAESGMMQNPTRDTMYVQPWIRRWGLQFQWATAAWWTGDAVAARSLFESLVETGLLVEPWATQAVRNAERALPGQEPLRFV